MRAVLRVVVVGVLVGLVGCGDDDAPTPPSGMDGGTGDVDGGTWPDGADCPTGDEICRSMGKNCGTIPDLCRRSSVHCGTCAAPRTCGGGGEDNVCGCVSTDTCESLGAVCGSLLDSCGEALHCGLCEPPAVCGGAGVPNQCGCMATMTCASLHANCGSFMDDCGVMQTCGGDCTLPETCGGGGMPNVCGCTPATSCGTLGHNCGTVTTDCGTTEDCGACTPADSCGTTYPGVCASGLAMGDPCLPTEDHCATGLRCCPSMPFPQCVTPSATGDCMLPDLTIDEAVLRSSVEFETRDFSASDCAIVEGCVDAPGSRRLVRFSTQTPNIGTGNLHFGDPSSNPLFVFSACHSHYHFEQYADYRLIDSTGRVVDEGHKQAFCLIDLVRLPGTTSAPTYNCGFQGISAGWADIYSSGLDCQWIDITGVPPGTYTLEVEVNPDHIISELRYDNNIGRTMVTIP